MDRLGEAPFVNFKDARHEVLNADGEERIWRWVKYRIIEPRFDRIDSQMPTLGIAESDAEVLANFLLGEPQPWWQERLSQVDFIRGVFGTREHAWWFARGAALMAFATIAAGLIVFFGARSRRRRRQSAIEQHD